MMDDDDDDNYDSSVPVRPYYSDPASGGAQDSQRERRAFRPKPPSERRKVEQSLLSWVPVEETMQSVLQSALRRQHDADASGQSVPFVPQRFQGMALSKFGVEAGKAGAGGGSAPFGGGAPGMPAPRKTKEYREGKSLDLADLAFTPTRRSPDGTMRTNYTPISLPYFTVTEEEEEPAPGGAEPSSSSTSKKGRPTLHHVDENNSNAAKELFLTSDGDLKEDNFLLIQLPSVLPELADPLEEVRREGEDAATAGAGAGITRLPDGRLGKLKIHKSGKVRMEIGGVPFCVDQGCATFFHQELACVCPLAKEIVNLGAIQSRVVLTPDVEAMFSELSAKAETAAAEPQPVAATQGGSSASGEAGVAAPASAAPAAPAAPAASAASTGSA